jgi:hypothetical protein
MVREYSTKTLACYHARLVHYQRWCHIRGYQHGTDAIRTAKLVEYVHDQIDRWDDSPDAPGARWAAVAQPLVGGREQARRLDPDAV